MRHRVDDEILDLDLIGTGSEQTGELLIDALHLNGSGCRRPGVTGSNRRYGSGLGVGDKEDPLGPEGERAHELKTRLAFF